MEDEPEDIEPNQIPVEDVRNIIEEIRVRPMADALDLLQEYDTYGQNTTKINPELVLKLRNQTPDDAITYLEGTCPRQARVQGAEIDNEKEGLASLLVHGIVKTVTDQRSYPFTALIDSGCTITAIDQGYVKKHNLPIGQLDEPLRAYLSDGTESKAGLITDYVDLQMVIGQHSEKVQFLVLDLARTNIFLGYDWLKKHNPEIDWVKQEIGFTRCLTACGKAHTVKTSADATVIWSKPEWFRAYATKSTLLAQKATEAKPEETFEEQVPKHYHEFKDVFEPTLFDELPERKPWDHAINLKPDAPDSLHCKLYPLSLDERRKLDEFLEENLRTGRIRPSKSPYASPFFFVAKKDAKELRPVQDYRKLNEHTIADKYPLPLISDIVNQLSDAKYFTKLDMRWGFNNVRIKEGDEHKAAFLTPRGLFEPTVMFFGLKNSPPTFQRLMNHVFRQEIREGWLLVYMDDVLIYAKSLEQCQERTKRVLQIFRENNLFLKPKKCVFDVTSVPYLGLIIEQGKIRMDPIKTEAITSWPIPTEKKHLQSFLGFMNFYRRFIKAFAKIAQPLNKLTGKVEWSWTDEQQNAFDKLKRLISSEPILVLPNEKGRFMIECDASDFATGAILSQEQEDGTYKPIAFISHSMTAAERNYDVHDKELLAIVRCFKEWRAFLLGYSLRIDIYSDHQNLTYFRQPQDLTRRQARWITFLQDYDFRILHRKGSLNKKADILS